MTQNRLTLICAACGHRWTHALVLPMPMGDFTATLRGLSMAGCPRCGARREAVNLDLNPENPDAQHS